MTKVPEIPESLRNRVQPTDTVSICVRGKKLHPDDIKALEAYMDFRKRRAAKKKEK